MLETRRIYKKPAIVKMKRIMKRSILLGLLFGLIFLGITIRNEIAKRNYPRVSGQGVISDLNQLTPDTKKLALEFLRRCEEEGLNVKITETYRTQRRQDELYAQGRDTDGPRVTWTENSMHTRRRAFDIAKAGDDPYGDLEFFERCAEIGREVGLESGHYWRVKDSPHFQNYKWWNKFIY